MKHIFKLSILFSLFMIIFASCKKEEEKSVYAAGTTPAFSADKSGTITVTKATKADAAVTFTWTNPNYSMNTGNSSQDVTYNIEMRLKGTGSYKTLTTVKKDLSKTVTQEDLNTLLIGDVATGGLGVKPDSIRQYEIRITSYVGLNGVNETALSSAPIVFTINKPYSVDPDLWITGEALASNWTNTPPASQKFQYDGATKTHSLQIFLLGGKQYKLLTVSGQWQPQWGVATGTPTGLSSFSIKENPGNASDPDAIIAPAADGTYTIKVKLIDKTATVTL